MNRPFLFVVLAAAILSVCLSIVWIGQPPSNQELLANTAKALDVFKGWWDVGGPAWWTPNFMQGTSLAPLIGHWVTSLWLAVWSALAGIYAGPKIAGFICLFLGTMGVYAWIKELTREGWIAAAAAVAFLLTPSIYVRLGFVEHMVFVSAFAVIPLVLWGLTLLVHRSTPLSGFLAGAMIGLLLLTYAKAAALLLPLMIVYFLALWLRRPARERVTALPVLIAIGTTIILGVLPNLPALREIGFAGIFELSPFEAWQNAFSLKSNILWLDRGGLLSNGLSEGFAPTTAQGGNYVGLIAFLLLAGTLFFKPRALYESTRGLALRFLLALALIAHWLSFGPHSILGGQLAFLKLAVDAENFTVPIAWFLLLIQPWIIYRLLPENTTGRKWIGAILSIVYLIVPGFRLISWLPIYADLRAPHDFSQVVGIYFLAGAIGVAAVLWIERIRIAALRPVVAAAAILLTLLDISPYLWPFFHSPLDRQTFSDFQKAEEFLANAPIKGGVYPLSGRYFYLLTPHLSGRGLTSEAFNAYLMQRGMNYLQATAFLSGDLMKSYLNVGGVAYVLIDKKDPDTDEKLQKFFSSILRPAFENEHFVVLENPTALAPSALTPRFVSGTADPAKTTQAALLLEKFGVITLPDIPDTYAVSEDKVGRLDSEGYKLDETFPRQSPELFHRLNGPNLTSHYQKISVTAPAQPGWIVVPMAFHPDWNAYAAGESLTVEEADGSMLAIKATKPNEAITLRFEPPFWYNVCLALAGLGWLSLGGLLVLGFFPIPFFPGLRRWLREVPIQASPLIQPREEPPAPIRRALIVIPTYNERATLPLLLEKVLPLDPRLEVLVVDDNSPDGTGSWVKQHPDYEKRVHLNSRSGKLGLGSAYKEGFRWAFERGYDACLEMDADLSHDPADIPRLLAALDKGADAAIGSRYLGGVRVMNWPEHRLLLSTGASRFVHTVTGLPLTDATSGFKALRVSALQALDWKKFRAGGYGFQVELHYFLWQSGARLVEVPIVFTERRDGETKMNLGIAIEAAWRTIQLALHRKSHPQMQNEKSE
jgi:dolichol-phosphate mannosyltransferase